MSSRLSRPIKTLSAAVSEVARGKLDTSIEKIHSMDELGRLSIGFNRMLKNLKKQVKIQSEQTAARQMVEKERQPPVNPSRRCCRVRSHRSRNAVNLSYMRSEKRHAMSPVTFSTSS